MAIRIVLRGLVLGAFWSLLSLSVSPAHATLKFYYDPATGNVSFDTAETRTGTLYGYFFDFPDQTAPVKPRPENQIRLSNSVFYLANELEISETTLSNPFQGLYAVGDILPAGLSEQFWTTAFKRAGASYTYGYTDAIGRGEAPDAQFVYGPPGGEFKNRWDLIDPATLTWATKATLIYRQWNGEVLVDTTGADSGYISQIQLQSAGGFLPAGFAAPVTAALKEVDANTIFFAADAVEPGRYSLGDVLPAGLSQSAFKALFTSAKFLGRAGFKGGSFDFATQGVEMNLQFVPEPSAISSMAIGIAVGCGCRKRLWRAAPYTIV
jgi:hypothetical protein